MSDASRAIAGAMRRALPILFTARVIGLATLPVLGAALAWAVIAVAAWDPLTGRLVHLLGGTDDAALWRRITADVVAVLMFAALAIATALAAIAVLTMPVIVKTVAARHYPNLAVRRGGTFVGSTRMLTSGTSDSGESASPSSSRRVLRSRTTAAISSPLACSASAS